MARLLAVATSSDVWARAPASRSFPSTPNLRLSSTDGQHPLRIAAAALLASLTLAGAARAQTPPDTGFKSPTLAGVASYFLPGAGSWYAGNDQHARSHGLIALGLGVTGVVMTAGRDCYDMCVPPTLLGTLVFVGYLTNGVWSVVTAVQDAHAYNDRLRTVSIDVVPALRLAAPSGDAMQPRVE